MNPLMTAIANPATVVRPLALTAAAGLLMLGLSACQSTSKAPSPGGGDPYPAPYNNPAITVLAPELVPWLAFHPANITRSETGQLVVQIPLRNMADRPYMIDYRFLYYDEEGIELSPVAGWAPRSLETKQLVYLQGRSLDERAQSYRLEVKWAR